MTNRAGYFSYADGRKYKGMKLDEVFRQINEENSWLTDANQDSVSGPGSTSEQTRTIVESLPAILKEYQLETILDIPCGNFNWMKRIDWTGKKYLGADILEELVSRNSEIFQQHNISFRVLDLTRDPLPEVDLVFCRDCLVHLSFEDIGLGLDNIKKSGARYLMSTTFPDEKVNKDIPSGGWRPLNLTAEPFGFPEPVILLNENCTEAEGLFKDKSLGMWRVIDLP